MNRSKVPGAVVPDKLLQIIQRELQDPREGRKRAIERAAKLGAVLKGLGYKGVHLGGVHRDFDLAGQVLDRMGEYETQWRELLPEFDFPIPGGFYAFPEEDKAATTRSVFPAPGQKIPFSEKLMYRMMKGVHNWLFSLESPLGRPLQNLCRRIEKHKSAVRSVDFVETALKKLFLNCRHCGDCGIQHLAYLCPESQCPKHMRNGACGGSSNGCCEVYPDRPCVVWTRVYARLASDDNLFEMHAQCVPPRMWELDQTSSWLNYFLGRDHQSASTNLVQAFRSAACRRISCSQSDPVDLQGL